MHPAQAVSSPDTVRGILVADDEAAIRQVLDAALRQQGFAVWLAADGEEAVKLYRAHQREISLVLLDVRMPGLDGPRTLEALHHLDPQLPCCFISGDSGSYSRDELLKLGALEVFKKPFRMAEIVEVVQQLVAVPRR
jgi:CheY-like chemotaxis protein